MVRVRRLGEILTASGLITDNELDKALAIQTTTHKRLGEILIEQKFIDHTTLTIFLANQLGIEYIISDVALLQEYTPCTVLTKLDAARYQAVILGEKDDATVIGIADPYDFDMLRELMQKIDTKVKFALLTPQLFSKVYTQLYAECA